MFTRSSLYPSGFPPVSCNGSRVCRGWWDAGREVAACTWHVGDCFGQNREKLAITLLTHPVLLSVSRQHGCTAGFKHWENWHSFCSLESTINFLYETSNSPNPQEHLSFLLKSTEITLGNAPSPPPCLSFLLGFFSVFNYLLYLNCKLATSGVVS